MISMANSDTVDFGLGTKKLGINVRSTIRKVDLSMLEGCSMELEKVRGIFTIPMGTCITKDFFTTMN